MLVLTRKVQQQIQIGDKVTITIVRVKGQTVRVGIEAPKDVRVVRSELTALPQPTSPRGGSPADEQPPGRRARTPAGGGRRCLQCQQLDAGKLSDRRERLPQQLSTPDPGR